MFNKVVVGLVIGCFMVFLLGSNSCKETTKTKTADGLQAVQTKKLMSEQARQIGMPNVVNFQQKKLMKMIYELCDKENLVCYAYLQAEYTGKLLYLGKCVGFGVPFSAQYTNPMRIWDLEIDGGAVEKFEDSGEIQVLPQPDPNSLGMATYAVMYSEKPL